MTMITAFGEVSNPKVRKARLEFEALTPRRQAQYEAAVDCGADHEDAMEAAMRLAD
jgi:hypothetical protein